MGRSIASAGSLTTTSIPLGGFATVFASGDSYRTTGTSIQRSLYPDMSTAFPRKGAYAFSLVAQPVTGSSSLARAGAFGNGIFVITMTSGATNASADSLYSTDGQTWTATTMSATLCWTGMCFGNGLFVAVGLGSSNAASTQLCTSPDGINWTTRNLPSANWQSVAWFPLAGLFVAISNGTVAATSPDGITWTQRAIPAGYTQLVVSASCILAVPASTTSTSLVRSTDGLTWTTVTIPNKAYGQACYGMGLFVFTVSGGSTAAGVITSPDGLVWTTRTTPTNYSGGVAIYGDGVFLCIGSGASNAIVSFDGVTWMQKTSGLPNGVVYGVFGNGIFFIAAPFVSSGTTYNQLVYTENLTTSDWMYLSGTAGQYVRVR